MSIKWVLVEETVFELPIIVSSIISRKLPKTGSTKKISFFLLLRIYLTTQAPPRGPEVPLSSAPHPTRRSLVQSAGVQALEGVFSGTNSPTLEWSLPPWPGMSPHHSGPGLEKAPNHHDGFFIQRLGFPRWWWSPIPSSSKLDFGDLRETGFSPLYMPYK